MRDRLIELLEQAEGLKNNDMPSLEEKADYLLANGIVISPCAIGQEIYVVWDSSGFEKCTVKNFDYYGFDNIVFDADGERGGCTFIKDDINSLVFLSKEDAEKRLRELNGQS